MQCDAASAPGGRLFDETNAAYEDPRPRAPGEQVESNRHDERCRGPEPEWLKENDHFSGTDASLEQEGSEDVVERVVENCRMQCDTGSEEVPR